MPGLDPQNSEARQNSKNQAIPHVQPGFLRALIMEFLPVVVVLYLAKCHIRKKICNSR